MFINKITVGSFLKTTKNKQKENKTFQDNKYQGLKKMFKHSKKV